MDREILGIDHGNRQMKTANTAFLSTVTPQRVKPSNLSQILAVSYTHLTLPTILLV